MNLLNISYGYYHMRVGSRLDAETQDSLESEDVRLTPSQDAELGRRMATFEADAKTAVPWEEIEADLIRRYS